MDPNPEPQYTSKAKRTECKIDDCTNRRAVGSSRCEAHAKVNNYSRGD
jgi:hypothetical protein